MYQQYLKDPESVDKAWWDFFADYQPVNSGEQSAAATNGATKTEQPAPQPERTPTTAVEEAPKKAPEPAEKAPERAKKAPEATKPPAEPEKQAPAPKPVAPAADADAGTKPLKGAAARV